MFTQSRANNFNVYGEFDIKDDIDVEPMKYNLQSMATPTSTLASTRITRLGKVGYLPGDTIEKEESVPLRFILDDKLLVYFNLLDIQEGNKGSTENTFTMMIQDNNNNIIARATYFNAWIQTISGIQYDITESETSVFVDVDMSYLTCDIVPV